MEMWVTPVLLLVTGGVACMNCQGLVIRHIKCQLSEGHKM